MESVIVGVIVLGAIGFIAWKKFGGKVKDAVQNSQPFTNREQSPQAPVAIQPVPQPVAPVVSPVAPQPVLPPNPSITDILYRPSAETGAILDARVAAQPAPVAYPLVAFPVVFREPRRYRVMLEGGVSYTALLDGCRGAVVTPTANDPAGQNARYSARVTNGDQVTDFGRSIRMAIFDASAGTVEISSDVTSEVWLEVR